MTSRSLAGRLFHTVFFETVALALAVPLYCVAFQTSARAALGVLLVVSAAAFLWSVMHRVLFDWFDWHLTRRPEALRPSSTGIVRSLSGKMTALALTFPMLIWLGGHAPRAALLSALALSALHVCLGAIFGLLRDRRRPSARRTAMC
ncbi:chlorhexidine efflux transporter [Rhodobacter sp. NSM]|uniref:chlorhexidine efflux transporter n=1 Tax=Rhodobacter sp. NSM TaxID=3457501 RepID=UPI003FD3BEF6